MSSIIAQEAPLGRKARRQRFAFQKLEALSAEIAMLRAKLSATEEALGAREFESQQIEATLADRLRELQSHVAVLEENLAARTLENDRLERNISFLKQELSDVRDEKERLRLDNHRLAAENKGIKVDRARNEIEEWRTLGNKNPLKRCYERIEGFFRKDSDDKRHEGFHNLLRLPPP